jgi:hypothetical protein
MSEQIDRLIAEVERQTREILRLAGSLGPEAFLWRPQTDKWSVGEHIEHISLTNRPYLKAIDESVRAAREAGRTGAGPYRGGLIGRWFTRMMEPPPRRRMPTVEHLEPPPDLDREAVLVELEAVQEATITSLRAAEGLDIGRARIRSPFLKLLKLPVIQAFEVMFAHTRRHIWLMREVMGASDSPATAGEPGGRGEPDVPGDPGFPGEPS